MPVQSARSNVPLSPTVSVFSWTIVCLAVGLAAYAPGLRTGYFSDDFAYVFPDPSNRITYYFTHPNPYHDYFRPINTAILAAVQVVAGPHDTLLVHLISLLGHVALATLVFVAARRLFGSLTAVIGSGWFLISQSNANGVLSTDTFSQIAGTLFGCCSLWMLFRSVVDYRDQVARSLRLFLGSLLCYAIALPAKESSFVFLPLALVVLAVPIANRDRRPHAVRRYFLRALPFVILGFVYLHYRSSLGFRPMRYGSESDSSFHVGKNVLVNTVRTLALPLLPVSSVTVSVALAERHWRTLVLAGAGAVAFGALVVGGLLRRRDRSTLLLVSILTAGSLFPMVLMMRVSELYVYNTTPFLALLVGAGLATVVSTLSSFWMRGAAIALVVGFVTGQVSAIWTKAAYMGENGARADRLVSQLVPLIPLVPKGGRMVLINPPLRRTQFSLYIMDYFHVLQDGQAILNRLGNRDDWKMLIVEKDSPLAAPSADAIRLTLDGDRVVRVP